MLNAEQVQALLDAGYSRNSAADILGVHHEQINRFILKHNIEQYIAIDDSQEKPPIKLGELNDLLYINENFKVCINRDKKEYLLRFGTWTREHTYYLRKLKTEFKKDAIDEWVHSIDFDDLDTTEINSTKYINRYVLDVYGSYENFRNAYGIDMSMLKRYNARKKDIFIRLGREFESLVAEVLAEISVGDIRAQAIQSDQSRPDFIVDDHAWVDAKLSRSTVFNPSCKTLDKYAAQAGTLTIIYAIKDCLRTDPRAEFVHIVSLLPLLPVALRNKTLDFVSKAQHFKEAA